MHKVPSQLIAEQYYEKGQVFVIVNWRDIRQNWKCKIFYKNRFKIGVLLDYN